MRYLSQCGAVVLAVLLVGTPAISQSRRVDEPPLVGTVMFRTSSRSDKLDINKASKREIAALPGMASYADKIIAGRPYVTKLDLVKRGIVPQTAYDKVKERIIAHRVKVARPKAANSAAPPKLNR